MLQEYAHFHPDVIRIIEYVSFNYVLLLISDGEIRKATEVTIWPFLMHDPLSKWSHGKILLIGDAAHPLRLPASRNV